MLGPSPYALAVPAFRLRPLAEAAGRAQVGGPRETVMAALIGARLATAAVGTQSLTPAQREARADAARNWLGTIALAPGPKAAAAKLIESTRTADPAAMALALDGVTDITAPWLDRGARSALDSLVQALRAAQRPAAG